MRRREERSSSFSPCFGCLFLRLDSSSSVWKPRPPGTVSPPASLLSWRTRYSRCTLTGIKRRRRRREGRREGGGDGSDFNSPPFFFFFFGRVGHSSSSPTWTCVSEGQKKSVRFRIKCQVFVFSLSLSVHSDSFSFFSSLLLFCGTGRNRMNESTLQS